jgi:ribosome-binding protein aMBF1 (putative translation factor)
MDLQHQDWKPIVIRKKKGNTINNSENKPNQKIVGYNASKNINGKTKMHSKKLDETEELKHKYVPKDVAIEIQKMRQSKNLTIKELATKLNIPKQDITNIEQCKALYNKALINKIKRGLK